MKIEFSSIALSLTAGVSMMVNAQEKQNILFIAVDDLKPLIGSYGAEFMKTPAMDVLAAESVVFRNAQCQQAVSAPSRASLLTGMRPDFTGVWDLQTQMRDINPGIITLPQYFKQNNYTTVAIGKIFDPRSVDKLYDGVSWSIPYKTSSEYNYPPETGEPLSSFYVSEESRIKATELEKEARKKGVKNIQGYIRENYKPSTECADVPDEAYMDGQIANNAIKYLESLGMKSNPFFLAVGFKRPHLPFAAPKKYWDLYKRDEVQLAAYQKPVIDGVDIAYHNHGELQSYTDIPSLSSFSDIFSELIPEDKQRELIHGYYASVSYIDAQIGKILDKLNELGLRENTIIVLWGDHGWHLGDHALWCKHSNFEQATRVPFMISVPGKKAGSYNYPVEFIDIFPTLCEANSLALPNGLQGKSLIPALNDHEFKIKEYAVSQFDRGKIHGYSIRDDQYRFTVWMKDDYRTYQPFDENLIYDCELYDYYNDPDETINLYRSKEHKVIVEKMMTRFRDFVKLQNKELAIAGSKPGIGRKVVLSENPSLLSFKSGLDQNWNLITRRGANAQWVKKPNESGTDEIVQLQVKSLGEKPFDLIVAARQGFRLKKGDILVLSISPSELELKMQLQAEDRSVTLSRRIKSKKNGIEEVRFEIPQDGIFYLKFQFPSAGNYTMSDIQIKLN